MKHRKGIDLIPSTDRRPIADMRQWEEIGGHCSACGHVGMLNRYELQRRFGSTLILSEIGSRLVCRVCGNRELNSAVLGKAPR